MDLHRQIQRTTTAVDSLFSPDQYNYSFLMNEDPKVHLHVVPRYRTPRSWEGVTVEDSAYGSLHATNTVELSATSLARLADAIRARLPSP